MVDLKEQAEKITKRIWEEEFNKIPFETLTERRKLRDLFKRGVSEGIQQVLDNRIDYNLSKLESVTKFIKVAAFKSAEVIGLEVKLGKTIGSLSEIREVLIGMQPHIPQACKEGHERFIDSYVGRCLSLIDKTLEE
jgi:hypothetical protein